MKATRIGRRASSLAVLIAFVTLVALALAGCAAAPQPAAGLAASDTTERDIASLHASKCGSCHTAPAPRTRTREHLEDAFARHKRRVRLTNEEWVELTDYLALPEGKTNRQP